MLDFIFQAGKVSDGRSTGSSGVHGETNLQAAALLRSDPGVVVVVVETDSGSGGRWVPPPPPSSHRGFPSIPRCLQPRSICSTCFYFSRAAVFRPVRCLPHDSPCFPPLSCSRLPKFVTFLRARVKIVYFLSLNKWRFSVWEAAAGAL